MRQGRHQSTHPCRRWRLQECHRRVRALISASALALATTSQVACFDVIALRPELRSAAASRDAVALADAIEDLVDDQTINPDDREAAYLAVKRWPEKSAAYAYARASLAGRLAEVKGLAAAGLIGEMEKWARRSLASDPRFRGGAARRMLGTLYVLAPASLVEHGDSEVGLELLTKQVKLHADDPVNHLRLAEGYLALSDPDPALDLLCHVIDQAEKLRPSERRLLTSLVKTAGGPDELACDE